MPYIQFQFRRGTALEWSTSNPTLADGEMGIETDTMLHKIGDGSTAWNDLGYATGPTGATGDSAPEVVLNYSIDGATLWHETYTEGDLYVRVSTDGESTWSGAMKFIGDDGADGDDGTDGNTWYSGSSDPSDESGVDGDFYLNTTSWDVFKKISGEWSLQGNIKGVDGSGVSLGLVIALT